MTSGSRPGKGLIGRSTSSNSAARISIRQTPRPCTPATACWRHVPVSRAIGPSPRRGSCSPWQRSPPGRRARLCCRSRNDPGTRGAASISANRACRTDNFHCPRSLPPKSPLKENSLFCPATQLSAILGERAGHASSRSVNLTTIKAIREGSMKRTIAAVFIALASCGRGGSSARSSNRSGCLCPGLHVDRLLRRRQCRVRLGTPNRPDRYVHDQPRRRARRRPGRLQLADRQLGIRHRRGHPGIVARGVRVGHGGRHRSYYRDR
jgi:hypothetical protein